MTKLLLTIIKNNNDLFSIMVYVLDSQKIVGYITPPSDLSGKLTAVARNIQM